MKIRISNKVSIILKILGVLTFSVIAIKLCLVFNYKPTYVQNQTKIQNQTIFYLQECEDCPPEFKPKFLYMFFNKSIDQDIEIIIPDGQHAVIHSSSSKQPQTIGYCECEGNKIVRCNLFYQYRTTPGIVSNYTIADFSNVTCEERTIPY